MSQNEPSWANAQEAGERRRHARAVDQWAELGEPSWACGHAGARSEEDGWPQGDAG